MHTAEKLTAADFTYRRDDEAVARADVLPAVTPQTRVGVVVGSGLGGLGAGAFLLSAVTAFYDCLRARSEDFFEYPDFYTFQVTDEPTEYQEFDLYPEHKNVGVGAGADAESLARAICDRAIDVLLVPAGPERDHDIADITRRSIERRVEHCYVYAPDGRLADPRFTISHPREPAAEWYELTVDADEHAPDSFTLPEFGPEENDTTQQFREVTLTDAVARLPTET
jgi:hypothetical protein